MLLYYLFFASHHSSPTATFSLSLHDALPIFLVLQVDLDSALADGVANDADERLVVSQGGAEYCNVLDVILVAQGVDPKDLVGRGRTRGVRVRSRHGLAVRNRRGELDLRVRTAAVADVSRVADDIVAGRNKNAIDIYPDSRWNDIGVAQTKLDFRSIAGAGVERHDGSGARARVSAKTRDCDLQVVGAQLQKVRDDLRLNVVNQAEAFDHAISLVGLDVTVGYSGVEGVATASGSQQAFAGQAIVQHNGPRTHYNLLVAIRAESRTSNGHTLTPYSLEAMPSRIETRAYTIRND